MPRLFLCPLLRGPPVRYFLFVSLLLLLPLSAYATDPCAGLPEKAMGGPLPLVSFKSGGTGYIVGAKASHDVQCLGNGSLNTYSVYGSAVPYGSKFRTCTPSGSLTCAATEYSGAYDIYNVQMVTCSTIPTTCKNSVKDAGEEGIDCGSVCGVACQNICPADYEVFVPIDGSATKCLKSVNPDPMGNCPQGFTKAGDECTALSSPVLGNPDEPAPAPPPDAPKDFAPKETTTTTTTNITNNTNNNTSTVTTTNTTVNSGGNTTNQTITTTYGGLNGSGPVTGSTTVTKETGPDGKPVPNTDNPANYPTPSAPRPNTYAGTSDADKPLSKDIGQLLRSFSNASPIMSMVQSFKVQTSSPVKSVSCGTFYGKEIKFDFSRYDDTFNVCGAMFLLIAHGFGVLVVARGW